MGKLPTDATTRQISAQSPGQGGKAKFVFGHGGALVFAIFGKDEVLSSKPRQSPEILADTSARVSVLLFFVSWKVEPVFFSK